MATEAQYQFFRLLFEEEERRYSLLETRGKLYMSIIAAFLAALVLHADTIESSVQSLGVSWVLMVANGSLPSDVIRTGRPGRPSATSAARVHGRSPGRRGSST